MTLHMTNGAPAGVEDRLQIDVERPLPVVVGRLEDVPAGDDAGIVDEHVQTPCGLDGVFDQILAIGLVAKIAGLAPDLLLTSVELGGELVQPRLVGVAGDHTIAVGNELPGEHLADAPGRACYHHRLLLSIRHRSSHILRENSAHILRTTAERQRRKPAKVSPPC